MEQEFPGTLDVVSTYLINGENKMVMIWEASTPEDDCQTPINMTNHAYWNLSGDFTDSSIGSHLLKLNCDKVMPLDGGLIPVGEFMPV